MADLSIDFCGMASPNPFWLASGPPTNSGAQVMRAFDAGWGGAVWKTLANPITNVSGRLWAVDSGATRMIGLTNIELVTDRPLEVNLREMYEVKRRYPQHTLIASLMAETREEWQEIIKRAEDTGCDGLELNFGCPHGMCERGMGSAVGEKPEVLAEITRWVLEASKKPVIVKLTPNVGDILEAGQAAVSAGAQALSLINTLKSIPSVDLDRLAPHPVVGHQSTNGGYSGPAVKPIALHMLAQLARGQATHKLAFSGIGGISNWRDSAEFIALGALSVQVCTAVMHYGYRIVEDFKEGLADYLDAKGMQSVVELRGRALGACTEWGALDLNHTLKARINADTCIGCNLCHVACMDGGHQCILIPGRTKEAHLRAGHAHVPSFIPEVPVKTTAAVGHFIPVVDEDECVGCNLCHLVCPVAGTVSMVEVPILGGRQESWNERITQGRDLNPGSLNATLQRREQLDAREKER